MCGIAGVYGYKKKVDNGWIKRMTDTLKNRGPDDEGFIAINTEANELYHLIGPDSKVAGQRVETFDRSVNLFLGHRRLSILDTSPLGHQPMTNRDKTIWIVHNGEIYNYLELREELKGLGHQFRTNTDTEVLLAAYEEWQEECLDKFNGMWSFVIYDARKNVLFGARDRFGVKPFYYYTDEKYFAFASEIKALIKLPFIDKKVNPKAVFDYLVLNLYEQEEEGFIKNIFELQPSCAFYFYLSNNVMKTWRYYSLKYIDEWERFDEEKLKEYIATTRQLLFNAVSLRLRSDVPVGTCLSGGIDSSTIVCLINKILKEHILEQIGERQKVFTVAYNMESIDESKWARIVVEQTKTSWHKTYPESYQFLEDLEDLVYTQDIPFGSTRIYAQYRVMKLAKENGVKVLLDGQGGDELFTGYQFYYGIFFIEMLKAFAVGRLLRELRCLENSPINMRNLVVSLAKIFSKSLATNSLKEVIFRLKKREINYLDIDFFKENRERLTMTKDMVSTSLNQMLHQYISSLSLKPLLRYEDRNSMRFSIEARAPFSDDINLIEYVFQIPSVYKIYLGWSKYLLREATEGILPEEIRLRKDKIGFATPEYSWLNENSEALKEYITSDMKEFLNVRKMQKDWDELLTKQSQTDITTLWRFINLAVWRKVVLNK
jgi:asparagine synthase (glutamine-hydrolysing)